MKDVGTAPQYSGMEDDILSNLQLSQPAQLTRQGDKKSPPHPPPPPTDVRGRARMDDSAEEGRVGLATGGRGDSDDNTGGYEGFQGWSPTTRACRYTKEGVCKKHGPGAKRLFRPVKASTPQPRGKKTVMKYFWVCETGHRGGVLRQSKLTFSSSVLDGTPKESGRHQPRGEVSTTPSLGEK